MHFDFLSRLIAGAMVLVGLMPSLPSLAQQRTCVPKQHIQVPVITKLNYHDARKRLIAKGWQPLQTISHNEAANDMSTSMGNGKLFWAKGYYEVEACAPTGMAPCAFLFKDMYGNALRVGTSGEEMPEQKYYAVTVSYDFVCR